MRRRKKASQSDESDEEPVSLNVDIDNREHEEDVLSEDLEDEREEEDEEEEDEEENLEDEQELKEVEYKTSLKMEEDYRANSTKYGKNSEGNEEVKVSNVAEKPLDIQKERGLLHKKGRGHNQHQTQEHKKDDPSFVPRSGIFFMHDDRGANNIEEQSKLERPSERRLWEENDEPLWIHDKFEALELGETETTKKKNRNSVHKFHEEVLSQTNGSKFPSRALSKDNPYRRRGKQSEIPNDIGERKRGERTTRENIRKDSVYSNVNYYPKKQPQLQHRSQKQPKQQPARVGSYYSQSNQWQKTRQREQLEEVEEEEEKKTEYHGRQLQRRPYQSREQRGNYYNPYPNQRIRKPKIEEVAENKEEQEEDEVDNHETRENKATLPGHRLTTSSRRYSAFQGVTSTTGSRRSRMEDQKLQPVPFETRRVATTYSSLPTNSQGRQPKRVLQSTSRKYVPKSGPISHPERSNPKSRLSSVIERTIPTTNPIAASELGILPHAEPSYDMSSYPSTMSIALEGTYPPLADPPFRSYTSSNLATYNPYSTYEYASTYVPSPVPIPIVNQTSLYGQGIQYYPLPTASSSSPSSDYPISLAADGGNSLILNGNLDDNTSSSGGSLSSKSQWIPKKRSHAIPITDPPPIDAATGKVNKNNKKPTNNILSKTSINENQDNQTENKQTPDSSNDSSTISTDERSSSLPISAGTHSTSTIS